MTQSLKSRFEPGFFGWISKVVEEKRSLLVAIARQEGLEAPDALDIVQDALVTLLELPQGRSLAEDSDELSKFLVVLVRNAARNRRRRHYLKKEHDTSPETLSQLIDDKESVEDLVRHAEEHVSLLGCMSKLKEVQFNVVRLRLLEEKPGEEVASMLDLSTENVSVLLHRAKKALKECLFQ